MKGKLVQIGNSKGVRIPSAVIRECGLGEQVDLRVEQGAVVLTPLRSAREGWDTAFDTAAATGDDEPPLYPDAPATDFDAEEWSW